MMKAFKSKKQNSIFISTLNEYHVMSGLYNAFEHTLLFCVFLSLLLPYLFFVFVT